MTQKMEKWDVHTHTTLSPATYEALGRFTSYADFVRIRTHASKPCCAEMVNSCGEIVREIEENAYDGAARIKDCDMHGVTMQVLSPTPMMIPDYVDNANDAAEICKILNDDNAATVAKFPDRFTALGALPLSHTDAALRELHRLKDELGMRGIEINSNIAGRDLDDPLFFPVFEAAAEMGMAVFIHPWGGFMSPQEETLKKRMNAKNGWRPWLIGMTTETALAFDAMRRGAVHERLPHLRVLYAHGGGAFPALLGRLEHGAYCRPDLFAEDSTKDPYQTLRDCSVYTVSLVHSPFAFGMLLDTMGAGRIAVGSDYPYPLGEMEPFEARTKKDQLGNDCPYAAPKGLYPGHMVEHLPAPDTNLEQAWKNFAWIEDKDRDGNLRNLPRLIDAQRARILSGTAKEWLGFE